jgi:excisionase family DNA binding protein
MSSKGVSNNMENNTEKNEMPMITITQAAIILNVHPNTIRNYIDNGFLKAFSLPSGKKILLCETDVRNLIQEKVPVNG